MVFDKDLRVVKASLDEELISVLDGYIDYDYDVDVKDLAQKIKALFLGKDLAEWVKLEARAITDEVGGEISTLKKRVHNTETVLFMVAAGLGDNHPKDWSLMSSDYFDAGKTLGAFMSSKLERK